MEPIKIVCPFNVSKEIIAMTIGNRDNNTFYRITDQGNHKFIWYNKNKRELEIISHAPLDTIFNSIDEIAKIAINRIGYFISRNKKALPEDEEFVEKYNSGKFLIDYRIYNKNSKSYADVLRSKQ